MTRLLLLSVLVALAFVCVSATSSPPSVKFPSFEAERVSSDLSPAGLERQFAEWEIKFERKYQSDEDRSRAFSTFSRNAFIWTDLNEKGHGQHGAGPFADMEPEEFAKTYLMPKGKAAEMRAALEMGAAYVPQGDEVLISNDTRAMLELSDIDWRGICTPIKNQGQCGSCWAFSATEVLESAYRKAGGPLEVLAPQQLVDCNTQNHGCNGGLYAYAFSYWTTHRSATEQSYPYRGNQGRCQQPSGVGPHIARYSYATPTCSLSNCNGQTQYEGQLLNALSSYGPMSIGVDASKWQYYQSGVVTPSWCSNSAAAEDHAVVIVAYSSTGKYYIVRNSWGTAWGQSGFIALSYGQNTCGLADFPVYVTASG